MNNSNLAKALLLVIAIAAAITGGVVVLNNQKASSSITNTTSSEVSISQQDFKVLKKEDSIELNFNAGDSIGKGDSLSVNYDGSQGEGIGYEVSRYVNGVATSVSGGFLVQQDDSDLYAQEIFLYSSSYEIGEKGLLEITTLKQGDVPIRVVLAEVEIRLDRAE